MNHLLQSVAYFIYLVIADVSVVAYFGTGALILLASRGPSRWQHAILEQAEDPNERRVRSPESGLTPRPEMQSKKVQKCPVRLLRGPNP